MESGPPGGGGSNCGAVGSSNQFNGGGPNNTQIEGKKHWSEISYLDFLPSILGGLVVSFQEKLQ